LGRDAVILLDSHVFVWLANGDPQLGPEGKEKIREAFHSESLFLSPISLWEIALKASRGRLSFDRPLRPWMTEALRLTKTHLVPLTAEVALDCAELPADFHGDPADRIIASTARTNALVLFTHDTKLLSLARKGYLRAERV